MVEKTLADCKSGDVAELISVTDEQLSIQLFCMGFLPGENIAIERIAPFGDPMIISAENSFISLRLADAKKMIIKA